MENNKKKYCVLLTKSNIVVIKAENSEKACWLSEFYTSDIIDLSNEIVRTNENFFIEEIVCQMNEALEVNEIS